MTEKASWKEGSALVRNEKLIDTLLDSIASGMYVNLACQSVGIDTSTLYQWKKKGQQGIHPYDKVWKRLQIAEAKAIERRLNRIDEASKELRKAKRNRTDVLNDEIKIAQTKLDSLRKELSERNKLD